MLLIKNAILLSQDTAIGNLKNADILIDGNEIVRVGNGIDAADAEVIDANGMIAIPGFVDAHRHNWESLLRCVGIDWTLTQYITAVKKVLGPAYSPEDMYTASYLGGVECLNAGITTLFDWFHNNNGPEFADAAIQGLHDSGVRAVLGYSDCVAGEVPVSDIPLDYEDFRRVNKQYFSSDDQLLTLALACRGPQFEYMDLVEKELRLAEETGVFVTMHVGDGSLGKSRPIDKLIDLGVLDSRFTFIHCNTLHDDEIKKIGASGANVVSCPEVELNMGHGFPPILKLMAAGAQPALGVDVVTSVPGDMFGPMRFALAGVRSVVNDARLQVDSTVDDLPLLASDVLRFATQNGANACKLGHKVGSITPGKKADIVLIDTNAVNTLPYNNPINAVIGAAHPGNVDTVIVNGRIVKRNKSLVGIDTQTLKTKVETACESLFARAGIHDVWNWVPEAFQENN